MVQLRRGESDQAYALHGKSHDTGGNDDVHPVPLWGIVIWDTTKGTIPEGFQRCDGTNGTTDLTAVEPAGTYLIGRIA